MTQKQEQEKKIDLEPLVTVRCRSCGLTNKTRLNFPGGAGGSYNGKGCQHPIMDIIEDSSLNGVSDIGGSKKRLKTLDEHRAERLQNYSVMLQAQNPHPNGIECPECGAELWDSNPMMMMTTLTSSPPQKNVHCPMCDYSGYRFA